MEDVGSDLLQQFPALQRLNQAARQQFLLQAKIHHYSAGTRLFHEGKECDRFILLLEGRLRVQKMTADGHEIVLYHVEPGQSCWLTNACLLGGQRYPAEAVSETMLVLLSIPKTAFMQAINGSLEFRSEIYALINAAINNLITLVQEVAFGHLNHRLAQFLIKLSKKNIRVHITHQELAIELGTAREVISRLLSRP